MHHHYDDGKDLNVFLVRLVDKKINTDWNVNQSQHQSTANVADIDDNVNISTVDSKQLVAIWKTATMK